MNTNTKLLITDCGLLPVITHWGLTPFLMIITGCVAAAVVSRMLSRPADGLF